MHRAHYFDGKTGKAAEHPSLVSDPIPEFIYKKMERRWAVKFAEGSVKLGSLHYYRTINDDSGMVVDPHEGIEEFEVTEELSTRSSFFNLLTQSNPLPVGSRCRSEDDRRLVFCASASPSIPPAGLPPEYDTWVQIEAKPAIDLMHQALLKRVPDAEGPVFKKVVYDPAIDGPDHSPPFRPFYNVVDHILGLHDRWFTKRTKFQAQSEVRVGWLVDRAVCRNPIPPLDVAGLRDFVKVLP